MSVEVTHVRLAVSGVIHTIPFGQTTSLPGSINVTVMGFGNSEDAARADAISRGLERDIKVEKTRGTAGKANTAS